MACPTIEIVGKKVILLNGYHKLPRPECKGVAKRLAIKIEALDRLRQSSSENPDASAFGFVAGRWVPAA